MQIAWLVQGKIDWLSRYLDKATDPLAAGEELARCHAWSDAIASGDIVQNMSTEEDHALLNAIATLDEATAQNAALNAIGAAVDGLVQAYAAPS